MSNIYQKLLDKGFQLVKYSEQAEPNLWYRIEYTDRITIEKLIEIIGEDKGYWECVFDNMIISIEIRKDLSFSQYLFTEQKIDFGGEAYNELTIEDFEEILNSLEDVVTSV